MSTNDREAPEMAPRRRLLRRALLTDATRSRQLGQVLPIFAIMAVVLLGGAALLTDVAWWWTVEQRMQRAADAAALAGAVYLPGNQDAAFAAALAEAKKNGFDDFSPDVTVTPSRDPDPRKLIVDIDGEAETHFARVFCWDGGPCLDKVDVGVTGKAVFVLPVPMGSPQNYYGVGYLANWRPTTAVSAGSWEEPTRARVRDGSYTYVSANNRGQRWTGFGLPDSIGSDPTVAIVGLEVRLTNPQMSNASTSCRVDAQVSWNGGTNWSIPIGTDHPTYASPADDLYPSGPWGARTLGSSTTTAAWGTHFWTPNDFSDANFMVLLTWAGCSSSRTFYLDLLEVQVTTSKTIVSPTGSVLAPQNFWGALQSQGAPNIQGDAYMTKWDSRDPSLVPNDDYRPGSYYQYAIEFPAVSSSGEVWLFDPGFCDVSTANGTGENWTVGGSNGYSSRQPISTFYDLYDMKNTPYDTSDDALVASSNAKFRALTLADHTLNTALTSVPNCRTTTNDWHNRWWPLATGLAGGTTYRLHTYSTDPRPNMANDQDNSTALNSFAIWSTASGGTPRVYGLGAMEAYVRLPGGTSSEFYLARIVAEHAGKTMVISLWDPGDTGSLAADLQILRPTATDYEVMPFSYSARPGSGDGNASDCEDRTDTGVTSVTTNTGGSSLFNGCWLIIEIPLPTTYTAPNPSSDLVTREGGWWKIRYNMSGSTGSYSTDLTTWQVELRGSPVHLVP